MSCFKITATVEFCQGQIIETDASRFQLCNKIRFWQLIFLAFLKSLLPAPEFYNLVFTCQIIENSFYPIHQVWSLLINRVWLRLHCLVVLVQHISSPSARITLFAVSIGIFVAIGGVCVFPNPYRHELLRILARREIHHPCICTLLMIGA